MKTKKVMNMGDNIYHVISEPGDRTRYDYFVYRDGFDDFCFMPCKSTFRFPQRLNYYDVVNVQESQIEHVFSRENCNPYTLAECIRTMKELHDANSH